MENSEKTIRETWFPEHRAVLESHGSVTILKWAKPDTSIYYCRYVFDLNKIYISGDIGEAVFVLSEKADVYRLAKYNLGYFFSKMEAYSGEKYSFNHKDAMKRMREWLNDTKERLAEDDESYDHSVMKDVFESLRECSSRHEWEKTLEQFDDFISEYDCDYYEWAYSAGDVIPSRVRAYLVGLKMAAKQLESEQAVS